jgi:hypothetical protein
MEVRHGGAPVRHGTGRVFVGNFEESRARGVVFKRVQHGHYAVEIIFYVGEQDVAKFTVP